MKVTPDSQLLQSVRKAQILRLDDSTYSISCELFYYRHHPSCVETAFRNSDDVTTIPDALNASEFSRERRTRAMHLTDSD